MECPICGNKMRRLPYRNITLKEEYYKCDNCGYREVRRLIKKEEDEEIPVVGQFE